MGKDKDMSVFLSRYILNHYGLKPTVTAKKSLIVFEKVVEVYIKRIVEGKDLLKHVIKTGYESLALLLAPSCGIALLYDCQDTQSFRAAQTWVMTLQKENATNTSNKEHSIYGVIVGIQSGGDSNNGPSTVEAETFARANNLQHFRVDLATASQEDISLPLDLLVNLCVTRQLVGMHQLHPSLVQKSVPAFVASTLTPQPRSATRSNTSLLRESLSPHMVLRRGEYHSFQPKLLHSPSSHRHFSPALRDFVLLVLLYRRYGDPIEGGAHRMSIVAVLPEEVNLDRSLRL